MSRSLIQAVVLWFVAALPVTAQVNVPPGPDGETLILPGP